MRGQSLRGWGLGLVFALSVAPHSSPQKGPVEIPALGRAAGVKLGYSTVEEVEKRLGKGFASTGGHPRGRRTWFDSKQRVLIDLDGFDYARGGRIIDGLNLCVQADAQKTIPRVAVPLADYGIWGTLFRKPRAEVLLALQKRQWAYNASPDSIVIEQKGLVDFRGQSSSAEHFYSTWRAVLTFREGKLCSVLLSAE